MSIILPFPQNQVPRQGQPLEKPEKIGQILFFTGVRFERHLDNEHIDNRPQRGGNASGKRRRKA